MIHLLVIDYIYFPFYYADVDLEKDFRSVEVPYGGMVLFSNVIPHQRLIFFLKSRPFLLYYSLCEKKLHRVLFVHETVCRMFPMKFDGPWI